LISGHDSTGHQIVKSSGQSPRLLRQKANVRHDVLHFAVGELAAPRMHRAEDNAVLNRPQQFFIGFQERSESLKISRGDFQRSGARSIASTGKTVAILTVALIYRFPACDIRRIVLRKGSRYGGRAHGEKSGKSHEKPVSFAVRG
jgi:hypothetical protein